MNNQTEGVLKLRIEKTKDGVYLITLKDGPYSGTTVFEKEKDVLDLLHQLGLITSLEKERVDSFDSLEIH